MFDCRMAIFLTQNIYTWDILIRVFSVKSYDVFFFAVRIPQKSQRFWGSSGARIWRGTTWHRERSLLPRSALPCLGDGHMVDQQLSEFVVQEVDDFRGLWMFVVVIQQIYDTNDKFYDIYLYIYTYTFLSLVNGVV